MTIMNFSGISKSVMNANSHTTILAFETSCDETGIALVEKNGENVQVLVNKVASQANLHEKTGGVVPEVAAREHVLTIRPLLEEALAESGKTKDNIDAIAVTVGPGLMPALSVGVTAARALSYSWKKPLVPVHHLEGHIYSAALEHQEGSPFPALALIVSGGHTMLIAVRDHLKYEILGTTKDDAVGEVFDKVARMLELPYPGGPQVSRLAEKGNPKAIKFPRPMLQSGDLHFSYSGLKTAVLYATRDTSLNLSKEDIAASFQAAVIDSLIAKVQMALDQEEFASVLLAGGVAANTSLRSAMQDLCQNAHIPFLTAPGDLCGDNAAMIGQAAVFAFEAGRNTDWQHIDASARLNIESFSV